MIAGARFGIVLALTLAVLAGCSAGGTRSSSPVPAPGGDRAASSSVAAVSAPSALRSYNINPAKVFVAGISAGGFFGVQMHLAHSATFKGAAIYAGGVDYCAQDSVALALADCGGEGSYVSTLSQSESYVDQQSAAGTIDPVSNLRGQPVYLWSGTNDTVVSPLEMNDLNTEYRHYGANVVKYDSTYPAGHGWESPDGELACGTQATPYMIRCLNGTTAYDSEQTWLGAFFGTLKPRNTGALGGSLINFDQTAFGAGAANSMDTNGYVFVPKSCAVGQSCGLVVAFHGCLQTQADIGTRFVTESGIDEWADRNGIVVLYPYAVKAPGPTPYNPQGCWDWWGYDDPNYSVKSGTQISIVYSMVQRLMGH